MRWLKGVVIGMAILIVLAVVALYYGLYQKSVNPEFRLFGGVEPAPDRTPPPATAPQSFGRIGFDVPQGCTVQDMAATNGRLFLRLGPSVAPAPHCPIIAIDPVTGKELGRFEVAP